MSEFPKIDIATQFHRNNAIPLDSTEIFYSLSAATDYVKTDGAAYIGQIITVVGKNSISAFQIILDQITSDQITSEKKLDPILTETNTSKKFEEISENFEAIGTLIDDLSSETSADIYTINDNIRELSVIVNKNIDFIKAISVDLSDDISNIVEFNNQISAINKNISELSTLHKNDIKELLSSLEETNNNISDLSGKHKEDKEDISTKITEINGKIDYIYSDLSTKIDGNTTLIDDLSIALDDLSDVFSIKNNDLKEKITSLSVEHKEDIDELSSSLNETNDSISELSGKHKEDIDVVSKKITNINNKINYIYSDLSDDISNIIDINAKISTLSSNIDNLSDEHNHEIAELKLCIDDLSDVFSIKNIELKEKISNLSREHKEDIDELSSSLNETNESISELSGKHNLEIETLEEDITELRSTTFEAISKNTELINNLSIEIESSIDELNREIDDISAQHKNDFENLLSKTEDLNNEIDSISGEFSNEVSDINHSIINIFGELISNTNNISELSDSVSSLNIYIDELSDKFETFENELSNTVPEYEQDPIFNKWKNSENVIAGKDSTAVNSSIAIGYKAEANHPYSIQLGTGTNSSIGTLQFKNYPLVDANGYIYKERIPFYTAVEVFPTSISIPAGTIDFKYESNNSEKPTDNDGKATTGKYFSKLNIITNVDGVDYVVLSVGKDDYWWKPLSAVPELSGGQCLGKMFSTTLNNDTNTKFSGEVIKNDIPASSEFAFDVLTLRDRNVGYKSIVVNWGDGEVSRGTDQTISFSHKADAQGFGDVVTFSHTYRAPNKKYIVRIYGDFYGIRPHNGKNIISRVFDIDLPIANSHIDFTDLCKSSDRLLKVEIPRLFEFPTGAINLNNTFSNCKNLITFKNYSNIPVVTNMENTFLNCENLKTCRWDMYNGIENIPYSTTGNYKAVYKHCTSLEEDISSLIPVDKFENKVISVSEMFYNTPKISCSNYEILSKTLWLDKTVDWKDTANCFTGSNLNMDYIPDTWGGNFHLSNVLDQISVDLDYNKDGLGNIINYVNIIKELIVYAYIGSDVYENEIKDIVSNDLSESSKTDDIITYINALKKIFYI